MMKSQRAGMEGAFKEVTESGLPPTSRLAQSGNIKTGQIRLSMEQVRVLEAVGNGQSVFVTGSAGTGKSYLLELAIRLLKKKYGEGSVYVTASTGLAACAIGGTTLHLFAGVGLGGGTKEQLAEEAYALNDVKERWRKARVLIIDEISMINGELFDKLEYVARRLIEGESFDQPDDRETKNKGKEGQKRVFGGLQLLVSGDFFQLPPIVTGSPQKVFAFQADCWKDCFDLQIELTHVYRQRDLEFVQMLNEIRKGDCSATTVAKLKECSEQSDTFDRGLPPVKLFPLRVDVDRVNELELKNLGKKIIQFNAEDWAVNYLWRRQLQGLPAKEVLTLCVGAQVILVKNLNPRMGLVNGARGMVVGFKEDKCIPSQFISPTGEWPVVHFESTGQVRIMTPETWNVITGDKEMATRRQVPLNLGWALSIHKCQGMTLEKVETDISRAFDYGMVYVTVSRVKSLDGLHLVGFEPTLIKTHSAVKSFYENLHTRKNY